MWSNNLEQLKEKILPGISIKESGCFECKIERAELFKSETNNAEALILSLRAIAHDKTARIAIYYKNKQGVEQLFNSKHLNQLIYLLKIKFENLKADLDEEGKMIFPMLENRKIGIFLSYLGVNETVNIDTGEIKYFNEYQLKGFYNTKSNRTTQEIVEKEEEPKTFEIWRQYFENENRMRERREKETGTAIIKHIERESSEGIQQEDDFPF